MRKYWVFRLNYSFQAFITHQGLVSGIEDDVQPLVIGVRKFNIQMHSHSRLFDFKEDDSMSWRVGRADSEDVVSLGNVEKKVRLGLLGWFHVASHLRHSFPFQSY